MCGIAGILDRASSPERNSALVQEMLNSLVHRGPDDAGVWHNADAALGHRRLSILDLSDQGHQPMISPSGRYVLILNGEIYNHASLRSELVSAGFRFRGHSDTEVLLALIEEKGLESALKRSVGMFALALWDGQTRSLSLARDRLGEKPLYYGWYGGSFLFASELKALFRHPAFVKDIDRDALGLFCRFGYIPAPHTIFRLAYKLLPGHILTSAPDLPGASFPAQRGSIRKYWSAGEVAEGGLRTPFEGAYEEAIDRVEALLSDAVRQQMHADVPLGAFLSGGIDSSTVVALMRRHASQPVKTYSIGFDIDRFNEAEHAKAVARYLGTEHTDLYVTTADAIGVIPDLPAIYDEPFADPSQIPTVLLSRLARKGVTVSLSGDGGDEIFCGYQKYQLGGLFDRIPLRRVMGKGIQMLPHKIIERMSSLLPRVSNRRLTASRLETRALLLSAKDSRSLAALTSTIFREPGKLIPSAKPVQTAFDVGRSAELISSYELLAMVIDRETYLPDDILQKVDRATMAVGLESRAPFLDHRVVEFASRLPLQFLASRGVYKRILRDVLYRLVPRGLVDRQKSGFSIPLAEWLRGELRSWAEELLHSERMRRDGYFNSVACQQMLKMHVERTADYSKVLWAILMFESWRHHWQAA
jgi:asparagine synthase (glutamine-hydrolysing)